jgi:hypothetical protein
MASGGARENILASAFKAVKSRPQVGQFSSECWEQTAVERGFSASASFRGTGLKSASIAAWRIGSGVGRS